MLYRCFATTSLLALTVLLGAVFPAVAQSPKPDPSSLLNQDFKSQLPRIPPKEPAEALATFTVQPGYRMEQVAAEPLVNDPVAIAFDENGRLFVIEMRDYSEDEDDFLGVVRLLEDTDEDGRFDKSSIFLDNLSWPTAVICYDGGIFVGVAPDILYCKDTNGDRVADIRKTVYTGFGRSNVQGLMNSFAWGLDNRIHGAASSSGGDVTRPDDPQGKPVPLRGRDFAFDPRTFELAPTSGGAQHGMSFDDWGRKFASSNSDHVQQVMFEDRYLARNPYLTAPSARVSIAADGPQAEVYRSSPVEPWRIVRTRLRTAGAVPGVVEGGGRAAGYFTGATGLTIYRGDAWPEAMRGVAVVADVGSNLVHRKVLVPDGVQFVARRIDDQSELVTSSDIWFRPVQFANAPDGTLYVLDMYREVIEHPKSLPPIIKEHLDLTSGRDRGRIYRIVPDGFRQRPLPKLATASTAQLVETLSHRNAWHRETAARLLYQRQDRTAIEPLKRLAREAPLAQGRLHAMYALDGLGALVPEVILGGLDDEHPRVRQHAVRLSERVLADSPAVRDKLLTMVADADMGVRYQLAFTLGQVDSPRRYQALGQVVRQDASDRWVQLAVLSSLGEDMGEMFALLAADVEFRRTADGRKFLETLAGQISLQNRRSDMAAAVQGLEALPEADQALAQSIVRGLSQGLNKPGNPLREVLAGGSNSKIRDVLGQLLASAQKTAADEKRPVSQRVEAIQTLHLGSFADADDLLASLVDTRQPEEVQLATIRVLGRFTDPGVVGLLLDSWPRLSPRLREPAAEALFSRPERLVTLLERIEQGSFRPNELSSARIQALLSHADPRIGKRAAVLLADVKLGRRQDVVAAYQAALKLSGDPARGKESFKKICAACHRAEGAGHEIGPNLATIQNRGPETILLAVLDPSREVDPQYVNYTLLTDDGRALTGMIAAETATSVTLKRAENESDTVLRVNVDELSSTGLSIMPEGVEKDLDHQAMADLIAYLLSLK